MRRPSYRSAIDATGSPGQLMRAHRRMAEGYGAPARMQAPGPAGPDRQATVSEPSGESGTSPSVAQAGRLPMMITFAPTGTIS